MSQQATPSFVDQEEDFHKKAARKIGCDDFGDQSYRQGLRALLTAYDREARFTATGHFAARYQIVDLLKKRLLAQRAWIEQPAILERQVRRPIIILGLVRTGSTALHYLMGQDPGLQSLQYWLACHPQPRPPRETWEDHPDYQQAAAEIDAMYTTNPSLKAIHFMEAGLSEECRHLLAQSFTDDGFEVSTTVPTYSEWYESCDMRPSYAHHKKLVQLIGGADDRRWLLKYPVHMRHLDALLDVYPDACVVWTHRDPSTVLHSYCSLVAGFRAFYEDDIDRQDIARRQLDIWAAGAERAIAERSKRDPSQFFDLHFADFMADPVGSVERIYRHFGQDLSEEGRRKLVDWTEKNPQAKHGQHRYKGGDIGVSSTEILDRFQAYMDFFGMKPEKQST